MSTSCPLGYIQMPAETCPTNSFSATAGEEVECEEGSLSTAGEVFALAKTQAGVKTSGSGWGGSPKKCQSGCYALSREITCYNGDKKFVTLKQHCLTPEEAVDSPISSCPAVTCDCAATSPPVADPAF